MKIEAIILRELRMRLKAPFETSFGVTQDRRILLVEIVADGVSGWGEVTAMETPSYNSETADGAWHIISDFLAPILLGSTLRRQRCPLFLSRHSRAPDGESWSGKCALGCRSATEGTPTVEAPGWNAGRDSLWSLAWNSRNAAILGE